MTLKTKKFKFSRIAQDGLPLFLTGVAIFCAIIAAELLIQPNKDLNKGSALLYITITTLSSSILDPIIAVFKVEKKSSKFASIFLGVLISLGVFTFTMFHSSDFFNHLISFSKRGGFTAISVSLLLLQLTSMNYDIQIESEQINQKELDQQRKMVIEAREQLKKNKQELIEAKKEIIRLKKK